MSEPITYAPGHLKRNPETGEVALRTIFSEDQGGLMANRTWLLCSPSMGARNAKTVDVESWPTLFDPLTDTVPGS